MIQRDGIIKFENERIRTLQEERLHIQKKTFTKWMNSFLTKAKMEVDDLFSDLADGIKLLKLLEIISSEKLSKANNGRMRVHKIENVNKSLAFLHTKVRLESIGAEDIVDGNPRLILGLIWTIILRFQIQEIEIDVDEENESSEKRSAKDALLLWCQRKTYGYQGVSIQDFTSSWRSGLGFNALIHSHRPDLFDYSSIILGKNIDNLNHAFNVASSELGIPRLLDAEDIDTVRPDEKSILTYIASYYHTFARMKNEKKSGKRIANIIVQLMDADRKKACYEKLTADLLGWIKNKTNILEERDFSNSLAGIQKELLVFKEYRTIEKPPKYKEKSEIEALYFAINTLLKSLNQPQYTPQDGQLINEIEKAWQALENAEHNREVALREELLRQEKLEQLNYKFEKKSVLREGYLKEMIQVLSDPRYLRQVDATLKKHEAISVDILARVDRFNDLTAMAKELDNENYHGKERVNQRKEEVIQNWQKLLGLLENHKSNLSHMSNIMNLFKKIETTMETIKELQTHFASEDIGPHLLGVEGLLQEHSLQELQVNTISKTLKRYMRQGMSLKTTKYRESLLLEHKLNDLDNSYKLLIEMCCKRRDYLEKARHIYHFIEDYENEESWLVDKQRICKTAISAKDLRAVLSLQQKHKSLKDEIKVRKSKSLQMIEAGKSLILGKYPLSLDIKLKIDSLEEHWKALEDLIETRKRQLHHATETYEFYTDANEAESWLNEKMSLVATNDYGADEPSAQALLQRHKDLLGELNAYSGDILNFNQQAEKLIKAGICTLELTSNPEHVQEIGSEEWINERILVPKEVWEEKAVEKIEHHNVTENKLVPHVKAIYSFEGQGMKILKGDIMILKNKTNADWWCVRKENGVEGFVPANYVRQIEPRPVICLVPKTEKVKSLQKVKKIILVEQVVPVKQIKPTSITQIKSLVERKSTFQLTENTDSVEIRQTRINSIYTNLREKAKNRLALLEDSVCLFAFHKECDDFDKWMREKEKIINLDEIEKVESKKRKFEKFLTDLSAASKRIEAIDLSVESFKSQGHSQLNIIETRQKQIHKNWQRLNIAKGKKEKSLEGASSVELFNRTCEEAKIWMTEKMLQIDTAVITPDLKTVQALQRRHQNLERELVPIEEKVNHVNFLGNFVKNAYPVEKTNVAACQMEVQNMWTQVHGKAIELKTRIEDIVGQQIFNNSSKALITWIDSVKEQLNSNETARDVETASNFCKKHNELGEEIKNHENEFTEVIDLGEQLLKGNKNLNDVSRIVEQLRASKAALNRGWVEKHKWLQQCGELQIFNREAEKIDAIAKSHEAFLEYTNLGNSLDEVEAILKRHAAFQNTLMAQDKVLRTFLDRADKLVSSNHYDSERIIKRKSQILTKAKFVKECALERLRFLQAALDFQKFSAEVEDLNSWLDDKIKNATDESYRDLSNLSRKLQKQKALECELRANEGQFHIINKNADALICAKNRETEVQAQIAFLNNKWKELLLVSKEKGQKLEQAVVQREYNKAIDDAKDKVNQLKISIQNKDVGIDLRSCKNLIIKQQLLESEVMHWEQKIEELVSSAEEMVHEGHFNANNIKHESKKIKNQFKMLAEPMQKRRIDLDESLNYHMFVFQLNTEFQWINEHLPAATSEDIGINLYQAQSFHKKHKKFEAELKGHQSMITKGLQSGYLLLKQNHPKSSDIKSLCEKLESSWNELNMKADERAKKLGMSLKAQQYLSESGEIEIWLCEKNNELSSTDYGSHRDSTTKLLTKHKAIELELDTFSAIITEIGHSCVSLVASNHPARKIVLAKQQLLEKMLKSIQKLATQRQMRLMENLHKHEYLEESDEVELWIKEHEQAALSQDYGQDYEHLTILQNKFDDLKHRVEAGAERVNQCESYGKKLIESESFYSGEIEKRQEKLRKSWENFLKTFSQREQKLYAAREIHRFHRDVAEALFRIQDKNAVLSGEMGKDLNSALTLFRKHEGFENDLVALEAQLQVLIEDSVRLQEKYPTNADAISKHQDTVVKAWNELKERSAQRSDQLAASCDLQSFLTDVRDLMLWTSNIRATLQAEEHVSDAAGATALKIQHDALYAEIEAREVKFRYLNELSDSMVQTGHYAAAEVEEKCTAMLDERQKLHSAWNKKKIMLEQKIDLFCFLRDAKQIDNLSCSQEASLSTTDFGQSVEDVQNHIKKHEEYERFLNLQEEKVTLLQEHCHKLIEQHHYDSNNIQHRFNEVLMRRQKVKNLSVLRKKHLDEALLYAQFVRDCAEAESWISEKKKKLEADDLHLSDISKLEEKIKKLQKYQAFQAEIAANEMRIKEIKQKGLLLVEKTHELSSEIKEAMEKVTEAWKFLVKELEQRGRGLEEAQDILEFNSILDKIEAWIRDKEMLVLANDTGEDLEHCNALMRKLDDVDSDMRVDDHRVKNMNNLAEKIIYQGQIPTEIKNVDERRKKFNHKWTYLQVALNSYRTILNEAHEIHVFNRDVDDTMHRIAEKSLLMSSDHSGRDLTAIETLLRRNDALKTDICAVKAKIEEHECEQTQLKFKYPNRLEDIEKKMDELRNTWNNLQDLSIKRDRILSDAYTVHKFVVDVKEMESWVNDIIEKMNISTMPTTIMECETQLELHQEKKAEIEGREPMFTNLKEHGKRLIKIQHDNEVFKATTALTDLYRIVHESWNDRERQLCESYELQVFKQQAEQVENWLTTKEAFLNNDDIGDSFKTVERLIKNHQAFEALLNHDNIEQLKDFAKSILKKKHQEAHVVNDRIDLILKRKINLVDNSKKRMVKLIQSRDLQQFLNNLYEIERWLFQKLQIVLDENYRDPSNLQSKIQNHNTFDAELITNASRIKSIIVEGEKLIENDHFAKDDISHHIEALQSDWSKLQMISKDKKKKLEEAYEALVFNRNLDEFNHWMDEVEQQLSNEDYGKDLDTVNNLLKKHERLEADVTRHSEVCKQIKYKDEQFLSRNHFLKDDIHERVTKASKRYNSLSEPVTICRENLEDSLLLHQFLHETDNEIHWLNEKLAMISNDDFGANLTAVQGLQKKHKSLEGEILSQEPLIQSLVQKAQQMIRENHFATAQIKEQCEELQLKLANLNDLANIRRLKLLDAAESQMFYLEVNEAESWIKEKSLLLTSQDFGRDGSSVKSLQRKHRVLQREVQAFKASIEKVENFANNLIQRNHFDAEGIQFKKSELLGRYDELVQSCSRREESLVESWKLFDFLRETDELQEWIKEQILVTASEDYGEDVEHVEQLIVTFEAFVLKLEANNDRIKSYETKGRFLVESGIRYHTQIEEKVNETKLMWEELKDLMNARQEALVGAKKVHVYDRTADETITLIKEKNSALSSEDLGQDLETIQALIRKQTIFTAEVTAIRRQVESVLNEANKLIEIYPDACEHIAVKKEETLDAWKDLLEETENRSERLKQAEQLQSYFDEYRDLTAWVNEMLAKLTAPKVATTTTGAEALLNSIKEHHTEIIGRNKAFERFTENGKFLISKKHFLASEIDDKIIFLKQRQELLLRTLQQRRELYELNLDTRIFLKEAEVLENWIISREHWIKDSKVGETIQQVEDLLRHHQDFEKKISSQEQKFEAIKRITLLEQRFKKQLEEEQEARLKEKERIERERVEAIKQKELRRLSEERWKAEKLIEKRNNSNLHKPIFEKSQVIEPVGQNAVYNESYGCMTSATLENRLRRVNENIIKRAESMKINLKQPTRKPSFATRRRSQSFRKQNKSETSNLSPVEIQGMLERKHELQSGGKRAPMRSWKFFYTVLCGQLLCFFKDENDFVEKKTANAPVNILNAKCERAEDYTKKKNVFRLKLPDGSEFLFVAHSSNNTSDWVNKISFHANLPPNLQLLSYDESMKQSSSFPDIRIVSQDQIEISPASSRKSSPDPQKQTFNHNLIRRKEFNIQDINVPQSNQNQSYTQEIFLPLDSNRLTDKPPLPPRGLPPLVPPKQCAEALLKNQQFNKEDSSDGNSNVCFYSTIPIDIGGDNGSKDDICKHNSDIKLSGWGNIRYDGRCLIPMQVEPSVISRMSTESSSEGETQSTSSISGVKGTSSSKDKDKRNSMFRIFTKRKR